MLKWRTLRHVAWSWSLLPAKRSMYTSWSPDCPLSTAGTRVLLLYNQRRLRNFPEPITLFLALHQMVLYLLTPIATRPVSAELKNWCLVILGLVGSAEEMADGVYGYIQQRVKHTLILILSLYRLSPVSNSTTRDTTINRLRISILSLAPSRSCGATLYLISRRPDPFLYCATPRTAEERAWKLSQVTMFHFP